MPVLPVCLLEPLWVQFSALLPERIASPGCTDATIRRRLKEWAAAGLSEQVHTLAPRAYARMIGLELDDLAVDGCLTKAPGGGEAAGRSPVDRGKQGLKRSVVTGGAGIPLHVVSADANRHDSPRLAPTLYRKAPCGRRLLPLPRRRPRGAPPTHPTCPAPLPLALPARRPPAQVVPNCRSL